MNQYYEGTIQFNTMIVGKYQGTIQYHTKCVLKVQYKTIILWTFETKVKYITLEISLNNTVLLKNVALLLISIIKQWGNNLLHSQKIEFSYQKRIFIGKYTLFEKTLQ